jgi:outer membrane autotransporter protein
MFQGTAGGAGVGGMVALTQNQNVTATGLNAFGILAQSAGGTGNGDINVTIASGATIIGGTGTGAGVGFLNGGNNVLTNNGVLTSVNQLTGNAMTGTDGNDTLDNFGIVIGGLNLGTGANAFNNNVGAQFIMGTNVVLGAGSTLTNSGIISPGAAANVFASAVTGNVVQTPTGNYVLDVDLLPQTADSISATGTGSFAGALSPNFLNKSYAKPGTQQFVVFSAAGGSTDAGLTINAQPRAVVTYQLLYPNPNDIVFSYTINFNVPGLPSQYRSIGNAINNIQAAGSTPGFLPISAALFDLPDMQALTKFYDAVGGGGTATTQQTAIGAGLMFDALFIDQATAWLSGGYGNNSVFVGGSGLGYAEDEALGFVARGKRRAASHPAFDNIHAQAPAAVSNRWRLWFAGFGSHRLDAANAGAGTPSSTMITAGGAFGLERQLGNNAIFGLAFGGSDSSFSVPERATSGSLHGAHIGAYSAMRFGAFYLSSSIGYGRFDNHTTRQIIAPPLPTETANARFNSDQVFGRVEFGHRHAFQNFAVTPYASVQFVHLWQSGYSEINSVSGGPGTLGLTFAAKQTQSVPGSLGLQFDARYVAPQGSIWTSYLRAAWVHEFSPDRSVTAAFNVAPGFFFNTIGTPAAVDTAQFTAGGNLALTRNVSLFGNFTGVFGKSTQVYSGLGGLRLSW